MPIHTVPIGSLRPDPRNARVHDDRNLDAIKASLARFGQMKPIVVDADGIIRAGNGTWRAAIALGWEVIEANLTGLSGPEAIAYAVADNRTTDLSSFDDAILADLLEDLKAEDDTLLDAAGFTDAEAEELLARLAAEAVPTPEPAAPREDPGAQHDRAAELLAKWGVRTGDLWVIPSLAMPGREHRLICGDSTDPAVVDRVMAGEKADLCFTSPPYNLGDAPNRLRGGYRKGLGSAYLGDEDDDEDAWATLMDRFLANALRVSSVQAVNVQMLAGNKRAMLAWLAKYADHFVDALIWTKTNPQPAMPERVVTSVFEFIFLFSDKVNPSRAIPTASFARGEFSNVYASARAKGDKDHIHGAIFPESFAEHHIANLSHPGRVIYEPFCGSGTTMAVCERIGRPCRGVEREHAYVASILERLAGMGLSPRLAE